MPIQPAAGSGGGKRGQPGTPAAQSARPAEDVPPDFPGWRRNVGNSKWFNDNETICRHLRAALAWTRLAGVPDAVGSGPGGAVWHLRSARESGTLSYRTAMAGVAVYA